MIIGIVNYNMGNIGSIKKKLDLLGVDSIISSDPRELENADKLILPGVGHFKKAKNELNELGLWSFLNNEVLVKKKPILGICLGLQLMSKFSEEGNEEGLGWFDAKVIHFNVKDKRRYKVPHTGWNNVEQNKKSLLFDGILDNQEFYFVHSYHLYSDIDKDILAVKWYEYKIA